MLAMVNVTRVAWFTYMVYITTWVGESIYHGQPNAPEGSDAKNNYDVGDVYCAQLLIRI